VSTKPQAEAAEPTSLQKLIGIRDDLKAAGLYEQVVAHAADQGVDLLPGTPDAQVAVVYEFAVSLLGQ
jgi:hypothetical protein